MEIKRTTNNIYKLLFICLFYLVTHVVHADVCPKGVTYDADIDHDGYSNPHCRIINITYLIDGSANIDVKFFGPSTADDKCPTIYSIQNTSTTCQFDYTGIKMNGVPDGKIDISDAQWIYTRATSVMGPTQVTPASPGDHTADGIISYHDYCYFMVRSGYGNNIQQTCRVQFPELNDWL